MSVESRVTQWIDQERPLLAFAFFRIVVGFMVWRHVWAFIRRYINDGFYRDKFYVVYWDWFPLPSEEVYVGVLILGMIAGVGVIIGFQTRLSLIASGGVIWFHLFLNQYWYRHNRYFILLSVALLCISPCNRALALDAVKYAWKGVGAIWITWLIRVQMTFIYFASATAKTLDEHWRSGRVLWDRGLIWADLMKQEGYSEFWIKLVSNRALWDFMTALALFTEFFLGTALWIPRIRRLAIWSGILFHGYIEVAYSVLVFSYMTVGTYFLFISPSTYNRKCFYNPELPEHQKAIAFLKSMNWLRKVQFIEDTSLKSFQLKDADGKQYEDSMAFAMAASCMPLPFFFLYPYTWLRHFGIGLLSENLSSAKPSQVPPLHAESPDSKALGLLITLIVSYLGILWFTTYSREFYWNANEMKFLDIAIIGLIFFLVPKTVLKKQ